jgi:hypothetical protein
MGKSASRPKKETGKAGTASRQRKSPAPAPPVSRSTEPAHRWTFLTNHAHVLIILDAHPALVLREVANRVGITERAVQRIVQDLEEGGFVERQRVGRQNHYRVLKAEPLRHPIEAHRTIGDLLALITGPL